MTFSMLQCQLVLIINLFKTAVIMSYERFGGGLQGDVRNGIQSVKCDIQTRIDLVCILPAIVCRLVTNSMQTICILFV